MPRAGVLRGTSPGCAAQRCLHGCAQLYNSVTAKLKMESLASRFSTFAHPGASHLCGQGRPSPCCTSTGLGTWPGGLPHCSCLCSPMPPRLHIMWTRVVLERNPNVGFLPSSMLCGYLMPFGNSDRTYLGTETTAATVACALRAVAHNPPVCGNRPPNHH